MPAATPFAPLLNEVALRHPSITPPTVPPPAGQGDCAGVEAPHHNRGTPPGVIRALPPRAEACARLAAAGLCNKQIARLIGVAESTVKVHLKSAFLRLGVRNRTELVALFPPVAQIASDGLELADDECAMLDAISGGSTNLEIAAALNITVSEVKIRVRHLLDAAGVRNRTALAAWWLGRA